MAKSNDIKKGLQDLLGGSKNLDPLQQTIFEQGPQAGFTPPEVQNIYQEGRTIFPNQPVTVDNSAAAWYELGQNAFNIANKTFGDVVDYLIETKANSVKEFTDEYQTKITSEFDRLQQEQAKYSNTGDTKSYLESTNELIKNIRNYKMEWTNKVSSAIDNGKGSLFVPEINYFDPNLDYKNLGLKYQDLATLVRSSARNLETTVRKTEWDAASLGVFEKKKTDDRIAIKYGQIKEGADFQGNLFAAGISTVPIESDGMPLRMSTDVPFGFDKNEDGTFEMRKDSAGRPIFVQNEEGSLVLNPTAGVSWIKTEEEVQALIQFGNNHPDEQVRDQSMLYTKEGRLVADTAKQIKDIYSKPPSMQSPGELFYSGYLMATLSDDAIALNINNMGLDEEQKTRLQMSIAAVRSGGGMQAVSEIKSVDPKNAMAAVKLMDSFSNPSITNINGVESVGMDSANAAAINNIVVTEIAKSYLHLSPEEGEDLANKLSLGDATVGGRVVGVRDADSSDGLSIATFFAQHPEIRAAATKATAAILSNVKRDSYGNFDTESLRKFAAEYTKSHMNTDGVVRITNQNGQLKGINNAGLLWASPFMQGENATKEKENTKKFIVGVIGTSSSLTAERDSVGRDSYADTQATTMRAFSKSVDLDLASILLDQISLVDTNVPGGANVSKKLPADLLMRVSIASTSNIQREYGLIKPNPTMQEKIATAKKILDDLPPVSEWGVDVNTSQAFSAFARAGQGGVALGITKIPTRSGKFENLLGYITPMAATNDGTQMYTPVLEKTGYPAFSIPSYAPNDPRKEETARLVAMQRVAAVSGKNALKVSYKDTAPADTQLPVENAINNASFGGADEVLKVMQYSRDIPITTVDEGINFVKTHADIMIAAAEADKQLAPIVPLLRSEFGLGGKKRLFTEANMESTIKTAMSKGAKTMEDVVSYVIGVARQYNANIPSAKGKHHPLPPIDAMGGVPTHNTDFLVQGGEYAGMVLKTENAPDFFDNMKAAGFIGNNIYVEKKSGKYYVGTPQDLSNIDDLTLVFDGKRQDESDDSYSKRFTNQWKKAMDKVQYREDAKDAVNSLISEDYYDYTHPDMSSTVLPSKKVQRFNNDFAEFKSAVGINSQTVDPSLAQAFGNYDWRNYWLVNGNLPQNLELTRVGDTNEYIFKNISTDFLINRKQKTLGDAYAIQEIRKVSDIPLNQKTVNDMLHVVQDGSIDPETVNLNSVLVDKLKQFSAAGWTPGQFEYQLRVNAAKKNSKDAVAVAWDMKPNEFIMDSAMISLLESDIKAIKSKINIPKGTSKQKKLDKLLSDNQYALDFKRKYSVAAMYPASRKKDVMEATRQQLLMDLLNNPE
jgi:hypothetical protein